MFSRYYATSEDTYLPDVEAQYWFALSDPHDNQWWPDSHIDHAGDYRADDDDHLLHFGPICRPVLHGPGHRFTIRENRREWMNAVRQKNLRWYFQ